MSVITTLILHSCAMCGDTTAWTIVCTSAQCAGRLRDTAGSMHKKQVNTVLFSSWCAVTPWPITALIGAWYGGCAICTPGIYAIARLIRWSKSRSWFGVYVYCTILILLTSHEHVKKNHHQHTICGIIPPIDMGMSILLVIFLIPNLFKKLSS